MFKIQISLANFLQIRWNFLATTWGRRWQITLRGTTFKLLSTVSFLMKMLNDSLTNSLRNTSCAKNANIQKWRCTLRRPNWAGNVTPVDTNLTLTTNTSSLSFCSRTHLPSSRIRIKNSNNLLKRKLWKKYYLIV